MYAKVVCKVMQVLEDKSGVSQSTGKEWRRMQYLVECGGSRPYSFVVSRMMKEGEQPLQINTMQVLHCVVEARPYQNKWYNDVKCIKVGDDEGRFI